MPECGATNPDYPYEPGCSLPKGHGPVIPSTFSPEDGSDDEYEHANPGVGMYWNAPKPPLRLPESDRMLLQIAVGPLREIEPYESVPMPSMGIPSRTMVAYGLHVGESLVAWEFVIGESEPAEIAKHLMRKWLEVRA